MRRITAGICCVVAIVFGLSSCGSDDSDPVGVDCVSNEEIVNNIKQCQITMTDTRRVTCLVYNDKAIECDWLHADGTDAMM